MRWDSPPEGGGGAVELEVAEADFAEEGEALGDFGQDVAGDDVAGAGEGEVLRDSVAVLTGWAVRAPRLRPWMSDVAGFLVEAAALTGGAGDGFADVVGGAAALFFDEFGFEDGVGVGGIEGEFAAVFRHGAVAAAGGAGTVGAVEGEEAGIEVVEGAGAAGAGAVGV